MTERVLCVSVRESPSPAIAWLARDLAGGGGQVALLVAAADTSPPPTGPVDRIYRVADPGFDRGRGDHWAAAIAQAARGFEPTIVMAGPTKVEQEALARAAAGVSAPIITKGRRIRATPDGVDAERDLLSGNAIGTETATGRPVFVGLAEEPETGAAGMAQPSAPEVLSLAVSGPAYPFRRVSMQPKPAREVDLEAADRVVAVGRGLQRKEDLSLVEGLAAVLGAAVGCTRPIAAESGWLSDDHWVGLTGHRVRPSLYVAVGISGAAQHLVGMRDSKLVVAINKDANAPIFDQSDFQVVGDLYAIVPELTRQLAAARASR